MAYLKTLVEDGRTEQCIARRARVLLAMADPDTVVSELAGRLELERTTALRSKRVPPLRVPKGKRGVAGPGLREVMGRLLRMSVLGARLERDRPAR